MKKLRINVLERVIKHMIHGDTDRAGRLMEKLMAAIGSQIVNESNYGNSDDPMFPARRELQRELDDDIDQDRVEPEAGELAADDLGAMDAAPGEGDEDCSADAVAQMIADLVKAGGLDEDKLAQIVDIIVGSDELEGEGEGDLGDELAPVDELPPVEDEMGTMDPAVAGDEALKL